MAAHREGPEGLLTRLRSHLAELHDDPNHQLDIKLFDEAEIVLPDVLAGEPHTLLLKDLASSLANDAGDPSPKVNLLLKLFHGYTWSEIVEFSNKHQNIPFQQGLAPVEGMEPFNRLMLVLVGKAKASPTEAAYVATMLEPDAVLKSVVECFLQTSDVGIAELAETVLVELLAVDLESQEEGGVPAKGGQGLVWRRLFGDRDVYATLLESCSLRTSGQRGLTKNRTTIAQARLMSLLPKMGAMDWNAIAKSPHSDIEAGLGVQGGPLDFATQFMVDTADDILMYRCLLDFYTTLLRVDKQDGLITTSPEHSPPLQYLMIHGIHKRTGDIYFQSPGRRVDPLESTFLYGAAASYIATYASKYPTHFLASDFSTLVTERLHTTLNQSLGRWNGVESPKHDLHVLSSLPRKSLFSSSPDSPLFLLPAQAHNADVLNTLATVFHGPPNPILENYPRSDLTAPSEQEIEEACAARTLYFHYLARHPSFWSHIVTHADTVALQHVALAALNCLTAVATASWSTKFDLFPLPSTLAATESGAVAILSPPSLEYTLPYLLKPSQTFTNLVGGRGDTESAAYKIAVAKYGALQALHHRLLEVAEGQPGHGYEEIVSTLGKRLAQGPMSREGEVGGRIGTMEL